MSDIKISRTQKALRLIQDEGITAKEAAERVGITNAAVSKGKCHPSKTQQKIRMLSEMQKEIESLRQQLAEKDAEIRKLSLDCLSIEGQALEHWTAAAASQAREVQLREALSAVGELMLCGKKDHLPGRCAKASNITIKAITKPSDTTALEAMITKAGEVMRERCESTLEKIGAEDNCYGGAHAIRALPVISLDDLK